jgi:hypothetical protein
MIDKTKLTIVTEQELVILDDRLTRSELAEGYSIVIRFSPCSSAADAYGLLQLPVARFHCT